MFKKIPFWLFLAAAVATLTLALLNHLAAPPQFFSAAGTAVTLEEITYATTNVCFASHPWQKWLYRLLPAKYKYLARCTILNCWSNYTNNPVFWVRLKNVSGKPVNLNYATFTARLIDEYGGEYDANGYSEGSSMLPSGESISYYALGLFPPHGRLAGISFYDPTTHHLKLGQLLIPGESITLLAESKLAASAPQKSGEMTFQLTGLVTGFRAVPDPMYGNTNNPIFTQATFRITRNGAPALNWVPMSVKVSGPRGESQKTWRVHGVKGDECFYNLEGRFDPAAGPVKLKVEFDHYSGFSANELVTFTNLPLPAVGETSEPGLVAQANGVTVKIERLYGSSGGTLTGPTGSQTFAQVSKTFVEVAVDPDLPDVRLQFLMAVDGQGRSITQSGYASKGNGHHRFDFVPETAARYMDLTFAVHRSQSVSFVATPVMYLNNAAAMK